MRPRAASDCARPEHAALLTRIRQPRHGRGQRRVVETHAQRDRAADDEQRRHACTRPARINNAERDRKERRRHDPALANPRHDASDEDAVDRREHHANEGEDIADRLGGEAKAPLGEQRKRRFESRKRRRNEEEHQQQRQQSRMPPRALQQIETAERDLVRRPMPRFGQQEERRDKIARNRAPPHTTSAPNGRTASGCRRSRVRTRSPARMPRRPGPCPSRDSPAS